MGVDTQTFFSIFFHQQKKRKIFFLSFFFFCTLLPDYFILFFPTRKKRMKRRMSDPIENVATTAAVATTEAVVVVITATHHKSLLQPIGIMAVDGSVCNNNPALRRMRILDALSANRCGCDFTPLFRYHRSSSTSKDFFLCVGSLQIHSSRHLELVIHGYDDYMGYTATAASATNGGGVGDKFNSIQGYYQKTHPHDRVEPVLTATTARHPASSPPMGLIPSKFEHNPVPPEMRVRRPLWMSVFSHCTDNITPLFETTGATIMASMDTVISGCQHFIQDSEQDQKVAQVHYILTDIPGHHAGRNFYGGYCYVNATAAAAVYLQQHFKQHVGILDLDRHAGDGTHDIFAKWQKKQPLSHGDGGGDGGNNSRSSGDDEYEKHPHIHAVSINSDPLEDYPYTGFDDNSHFLVFPKGCDKAAYLALIERARVILMDKFKAQWLVIAFGTDTSKHDPEVTPGFETVIENEDYYEFGKAIAAWGLRVLVIQEGGYNPDVSGTIVVQFLAGLSSSPSCSQ